MPCTPLVAVRGELLHSVTHDAIAKPWSLGHADRSLLRYFDGWFYDVFVPVALARRDITRERKPRERRHRNVVGAADTGLEHASTPNRDSTLAAGFLHPLRFGVAADSS